MHVQLISDELGEGEACVFYVEFLLVVNYRFTHERQQFHVKHQQDSTILWGILFISVQLSPLTDWVKGEDIQQTIQ